MDAIRSYRSHLRSDECDLHDYSESKLALDLQEITVFGLCID